MSYVINDELFFVNKGEIEERYCDICKMLYKVSLDDEIRYRKTKVKLYDLLNETCETKVKVEICDLLEKSYEKCCLYYFRHLKVEI